MAPHHIAAMLVPIWGHTVSYIHLAKQMLQQDPNVVVTMVQHNSLVAQMEAELRTSEYDVTRIQITGVGDVEVPFSPTQFKLVTTQLILGWLETMPKLAQGSQGWPKPRTLHMDFFGGGFVFEPTKQILGSDCKTLLWWSTALVSLPGHLTDLDFAVIAQEIFSDETRRQGRSIEQILDAVVIAWNGTDKASGAVINFPGAPDMYDYERFARGAGTPEGLGAALVGAQKFAKLANGYIVPTARCLEPIGVLHWKQFCGNRGQEFFPVGVQANDACWMDNVPGTVAPTNERVKSFLDNAVSQHGGKSVLYISFGSLYFPFATREHVLALVETLLDLPSPFPFLFTLGGKLASLPTDLIERVNSSGKGLICDFWVEQREILQSGAIGWFLTHGGFNSTSESLTQGIPLIIWPLAAEQPVNAALLAQDPHPVAIELFQIRTGEQLGPSLRGGIPITGSVADAVAEFKRTFEVARGEKGALIKENAVNMAMELRRARRGEVAAEIKRLAAF